MKLAYFSQVSGNAVTGRLPDGVEQRSIRVIFGVRPFFAWMMDPSNPVSLPANAGKNSGSFSAPLWGPGLSPSE